MGAIDFIRSARSTLRFDDDGAAQPGKSTSRTISTVNFKLFQGLSRREGGPATCSWSMQGVAPRLSGQSSPHPVFLRLALQRVSVPVV